MTQRLLDILVSSFPRLVLYCVQVTIPLTVCIYILSLVLGFLLALIQIQKIPVLKQLARLIGKRAADFYEYAISQANGCLVCSIYFRNLLKKNGIDFDTFEFTPEEQVLIDYGRAIANDPKHVPEGLFTRLKTYFNEEQIVVITAMGVMMIANNYFNDILDVTPDHLA